MATCSRRIFLLGSAATFAGVYLAACGSTPSAEIAATEIPVGSAIILDGVIFAQPEPGVYKAYSQRCPHQGANITQVDGNGTVTCTSHFTTYDLSTGEPLEGPGRDPLVEYPTETDGDLVRTGS